MNPIQPPMTNREIALDFAMRLAITVGESNGAAVVKNAEAFLAFLDAVPAPTVQARPLSFVGAVE